MVLEENSTRDDRWVESQEAEPIQYDRLQRGHTNVENGCSGDSKSH